MEKRRKLKHLYIAGIITILLLLLVGGMLVYVLKMPEEKGESSPSGSEEMENGLTENLLPENLIYGKPLPVESFQDKTGQPRSLEEYRGKNLILIFWNSWCPDCSKAFEAMPVYEEVLKEDPDTELLLIARLDEEQKETVEKAEAKRKEENIEFESWYDPGLKAYRAYGARQIPTMLVLNTDGELACMTTTVPDTAGALKAMLADVKNGSDKSTLTFLENNLMSESGAVYTSMVKNENASASGKAVLSESQGLLMEYAVLAEDQKLFQSVYTFLQQNMELDNCFTWMLDEENQKAKANALLDDLRILKALDRANTLWGDYEEDEKKLAEGILEHNVISRGVVSFYDFDMKKTGNEISLGYLDMNGLELLKKYDDSAAEQIDSAREVLEKGYISDAFPLYYASYNYKKKKYSDEDLNTAEALLTLYHLAQEGNLKEISTRWLRNKVKNQTLGAKYHTDGSVAEGYGYESTAVYGIAALIGMEISDDQLYTMALQAMEKTRVRDLDSRLNGSFTGTEDGSDITVFDQLIPLLVYANEGGRER